MTEAGLFRSTRHLRRTGSPTTRLRRLHLAPSTIELPDNGYQ